MAGMQQVVAAVREHNSTPSGLFTGHPAQQFFLADYPSQRLPSASDLAYFAHNFTTRAALALSYNAVSMGHEVLTISASFLDPSISQGPRATFGHSPLRPRQYAKNLTQPKGDSTRVPERSSVHPRST